MKHRPILPVLSALLATALGAQTPPAAPPAPEARLVSHVYEWTALPVVPNPLGMRRPVFEGPTATLDKLNCHITTLNPGKCSGAPRKHVQEEVVIVREGTLEANFDGHAEKGGPGSVIFLASGATTFLRNAGTTPVTYVVIYYYTPLTPKH